MKVLPLALSRVSCAAILASIALAPSRAAAAPAAPSGAHPRIWLTAATEAAMKAKLGNAKSAASRVVSRCKDIQAHPNNYSRNDDWQWSFGAPSCALAWRLTGDASYATTAITYWNALLDDYQTLDDGAGGDDVVRHDAGYEIRTFGPYAAMIYDWMHDAPGVDDTLLSKARGRFSAWLDWYATDGYLNDTPGSNYHAGYVYAKSLIAIAEGGEAGAKGDAYWTDAVDNLFAKQIVAKGLGPKGAITGGDWPEGWQYGTLSVIEYALAARALEEQGVKLPDVDAWASQLAVNYMYAVPPTKKGLFTDGDLDNDAPLAALSSRPLLAAIGGTGSDEAASWASFFCTNYAKDPDQFPVYDALAEARGATAADFEATKPPIWYLTPGTRKLYVRSGWGAAAATGTWAIFTSAPRLVPDHQHVDASSFVFTRGGDHIISDPSPYGSLSTLTGNAITVDSDTVESDARPSQSIWENASEMPWARAVTSGIAAARAELSGAFDAPHGRGTDVPFARRDWAYLPEGEIVVIDRARTDDANRAMHLRFRTEANLQAGGGSPYVASGPLGASKAIIHAVSLSGGSPDLRTIANRSCDNVTWGQCDAARYKVTEYFVTVPGPTMHAVHVIDGVGTSEATPTVAALSDPTVDSSPAQNDGVLGASVLRGTTRTLVVASSGKDGNAGASMTYGYPADGATRHVVFDAPEDGSGKSSVATKVDNGRCVVTITASGPNAFAGHPLVFSVSATADGCKTAEDQTVEPGGVKPGGGASGNGANGGTAESSAAADAGCACRTSERPSTPWTLLTVSGVLVALGLVRKRASRKA